MITRRDWLRSAIIPTAAGLLSCARRKSPRYQGYALVANHDSRSLAVIDLSRFQQLKEIPLNAAPSWVIAASAHNRAYILSAGEMSVSVLNLDTMLLEKDIPLGARCAAARLSQDGNTLWVLLESPNRLAGFSTASGARLTNVGLPAVARDLDECQGCVAIAFRDDRRVGWYRTSARAISLSPKLEAAPDLICLRSDGKVLLTGNTEDRSMTAVDTKTLAPLVTLPLSLAPKHFCFNSDGGQLFVTGDGMDAVVIVSPYQTEVNETILAGNAPGSMAATTATPNYLFVTNPHSGDVTVINIDNRRVLAQIQVGQRPSAVLLTPDNEYALILNEQSGDVAVIRLLNIRVASPESRRNRIASLFTLIPVGSRPVAGAVIPQTT